MIIVTIYKFKVYSMAEFYSNESPLTIDHEYSHHITTLKICL